MDNKTNRIELHFLQQFFPRFSSIFFRGWGVSLGDVFGFVLSMAV